jgi:hypothetical protein
MPRCFTKWGKKGNSQSGSLAKVYLAKQGKIGRKRKEGGSKRDSFQSYFYLLD